VGGSKEISHRGEGEGHHWRCESKPIEEHGTWHIPHPHSGVHRCSNEQSRIRTPSDILEKREKDELLMEEKEKKAVTVMACR